MLRNYLTVAVRNLVRHRLYALINVVGLAVGIAACTLILLYIQAELDWDQGVVRGECVYRVVRETRSEDEVTHDERTSGGLAPVLREEYPEVSDAGRLLRRDAWVKYRQEVFGQVVCVAERAVFDMLHFPLVHGTVASALSRPSTAVITQSLSRKLFGERDPVGEVVTVESSVVGGDYTVTGILRDFPGNVTMRFDLLTSRADAAWWLSWNPTGFRYRETYVRLDPQCEPEKLAERMSEIILRHMGEETHANSRYHLQPFERIYLHSRSDYGISRSDYDDSGVTYGDISTVRGAALVAGFILLIAAVNFVNLATARSASRAREVGMRKVAGARREELVVQFIGESVLLALVAYVLALGLAEAAQERIADLTGLELSLTADGGAVALGVLGLSVCVGILAGAYPAFYLSGFRPAGVLKGSVATGRGRGKLRKGLVTAQFAISVALAVATAVVYTQLQYLRKRDLGFDREAVVELPIFRSARDSGLWGPAGVELFRQYNTVKEAFLQHPRVVGATATRFLLGRYAATQPFVAEGTAQDEWHMHMLGVDEDFLDFYGMEIVAGTGFSRSLAPLGIMERGQRGLGEEYILNETAVKRLGWTDPVGKRFWWQPLGKGTVVGVVGDFHFLSLREQLLPLVLTPQFNAMKYLQLRIVSGNLEETLGFLEETWKSFVPNRPFEFAFLDGRLDRLYRAEAQQGQLFGGFACLAIFVACLGLFGLTAFAAEQRTKEIGVRKVLGATIPGIVGVLSSDFVKLVVAANAIAWPVAWYGLRQWLQGFPYRVEVGAGVFLLSGAATLVVAFLTVGYQAVKAACANPVDALRQE